MPIASSADPVRAAAATIRRLPSDRARRTPWSPGGTRPQGVRRVRRGSSGGHHGRMAMLLSVNVGLPRDVAWNGQTVHTGIWKAAGCRAGDGAPAEPRRRRAGRPGRARRRAARGHGLPGPVLRALASAPEPLGPGLGELRRELHRRRAARRPGVHRRPLPHRRGRVRGHAAARHLLPRRAAPGRAADARAARGPPPARLLPPGPAGGPRAGGRRHRPDRRGGGADQRRRHRRPALPARPGRGDDAQAAAASTR